MNDREVQQYIKKVQTMGSVYGLDTIRELLRRLGNPQDKLKIIHIAGTNGKGSILKMLERILRESGVRCGSYISPTIFTYLERFQINGTYMKQKDLTELMTKVANTVEEMTAEGFAHPTLFEMETAIAFLWFLKEKAEVVLLETGMGGRLDSTNIIKNPLCVVFASISRDHMAFLGDTLTEITQEKAGIIKEHCKIVAYPNDEEVQRVLAKEADKHKAQIQFVKKDDITFVSGNLDEQIFSYKQYKNLHLALLGQHQLLNASVVLEVVEQLKEQFVITEEQIREGLAKVQWQGRLEVLQKNPTWIRDGAHNEDAVKQLKKALLELFPNKMAANQKFIYIMGVFADKEYKKMLEIIAPLADMILTIATKSPRALPSEQLANVAREYTDWVIDCKTLDQAVSLAKQLARKQDVVITFGSLSFLGQLTQDKKERFMRIVVHEEYQKALLMNQKAEKERIFCRHNIEHFLDVARIAYVKVLEQQLPLSKDIVYGAALLHDLGRYQQYEQGIPHDQASAVLAEIILEDCDYQKEEISLILNAILNHRTNAAEQNSLQEKWNHILYEADKQSRLCLFCLAKQECNWNEEKKNHQILY